MREQNINGIALKEIRDFFIHNSDKPWSLDDMSISMHISKKMCKSLIEVLLNRAYIVKENDGFIITQAGRVIERYIDSKPIHRKTANLALKEFFDRVEHLKSDINFLYLVDKVYILGEFLEDKDPIDVVVLGVKLKKRYSSEIQEKQERLKTDEEIRRGKNFSGFIDQLFWQSTKVIMYLKNKKRALRIFETYAGFEPAIPCKLIYKNDNKNFDKSVWLDEIDSANKSKDAKKSKLNKELIVYGNDEEIIYSEGKSKIILINKYERNTKARKQCIKIHGCYCHCCGLNFEEKYGKLGKGFIHIHHKTRISEIKSEYIINPELDLIPVCPNCHAMLHRGNKILTIEELKKILNRLVQS